MPGGINVKTRQGADRIRFGLLDQKVKRQVKVGMGIGAEHMAAEARRLAPVKSGKLKRNIRADVRTGSAGPLNARLFGGHIISAVVGVTALNMRGDYNYAWAQEKGVKDGPRGYVVITKNGPQSPWTSFHSAKGPTHRKSGRLARVKRGFPGRHYLRGAFAITVPRFVGYIRSAGTGV